MNYKQNEKSTQVKESTLGVGIDIGSTTQYARAFNWRGIELGKSLLSATAEKDLKTSKTGCSVYRTSTKSHMQS